MLTAAHQASVLALQPAAALSVWFKLKEKYNSFPPPPFPPANDDTAQALLDRLTLSRLDHASIVVPLCRSATRSTLETLIGHPVVLCAPRGSHSVAARARPRSPAQVSAAATDTRTVLTIVPNPKKPGTASFERFRAYVVGETVAEASKRGLTTADLKWDLERGFVTLGA